MLTDVALDSGRVTAWPTRIKATAAQPRVAVVTANYNTRLLVAQLIYSLYARLGDQQVAQVVVVDNASTDGSRSLLERMAASGLCALIANDAQRYHGPALNQAMNWLAERQRMDGPELLIDYVWVLDSDCVVMRGDTLFTATRALQHAGGRPLACWGDARAACAPARSGPGVA